MPKDDAVDEIKKAEQRGYSRGYHAGVKRKKGDIRAQRTREEERAFKDRAFLAALPVVIQQKIEMEGTEHLHVRQVKAAWWFADHAMRQRRVKNP